MTAIRFLICCFLVIVNTGISSFGILCMAIVKWIVPMVAVKHFVTSISNKIMWLWVSSNHFILNVINPVKWTVEGGDELHKNGWYLVISNHQSWADIVVLCSVLRNRAPMPKFFLKHELLYVPFIGIACWALDMPFMRRYSKEYVAKHPEKKGQDLLTTRRSCAKYQYTPTTVVNYAEGTRYSQEKAIKTSSPYQHLLAPKSGGVAYTLAAMGEQFDYVVDVTIAYPDNLKTPFRDMLSGKLTRIVVKIDMIPIAQVPSGEYIFKREFHAWLHERWQQKDRYLDELYKTGKTLDSRLDKAA